MEEKPIRRSQFNIRKPEYLETFEPFKDSLSFKQILNVVQSYVPRNQSFLRCLDSMAGTGLVGRKIKEMFPIFTIGFKKIIIN